MGFDQWPPKETFHSHYGRVKLVPPEDEHDPDLVALRVDPETRRYSPCMPADLTLEEWRKRRGARARNEECWDLNILFTSEDVIPEGAGKQLFVGICGVFCINEEIKSGEIGIMLRSDLYRNYIATEVLYCNLGIAFEHPNLELYRVEFVTGASNVRMRGWLEHYGVSLEYTKKEAWPDGKGGRMDVVVYTIFRPEWPALKARLETALDARFSKP